MIFSSFWIEKRNCIALFFVVFIFYSPQSFAQRLETGDIIFRGAQQSSLSMAIDEVTKTEESVVGFSHVGILFYQADSIVVYHSSPEKGVHISSLNRFLYPDSDSSRISIVYRIKEFSNKEKRIAKRNAKKYLGEPYNFTYILEDKGLYCSEYVYEVFKTLNIFELKVMTFKNPGENTFNSTWIDHYEKLGIDIPEGKLGCNPNGMSSNINLIKIKEFRK